MTEQKLSWGVQIAVAILALVICLVNMTLALAFDSTVVEGGLWAIGGLVSAGGLVVLADGPGQPVAAVGKVPGVSDGQ